ncbi:MAG: thiol-activated cytolysin family protein [Mariniblastus sp.]
MLAIIVLLLTIPISNLNGQTKNKNSSSQKKGNKNNRSPDNSKNSKTDPLRKRKKNNKSNNKKTKDSNSPKGTRQPPGVTVADVVKARKSRPQFLSVKSSIETNGSFQKIIKGLAPDNKRFARVAIKELGSSDGVLITSENIDLPDRKETEGETTIEGDYICTSIEVEETIENKEQYIIGALGGLYPGMVLNGDELHVGQYVEVTGKRKPHTIVFKNGPTVVGNPVAEVNDPSLDTVEQATSKLLQTLKFGSTPAEAIKDYAIVRSQEQVSLEVGAAMNYAALDVASQLDFDYSEAKTNILVTFKQMFYEIHTDRMDGEVFVSRKTVPSDIYISRVGYGRLMLFSFSSSATHKELEGALRATFDGVGVGGEVNVTASEKKIVEECKINVYVHGGSATNAVKVINNGVDGIASYVRDGAQFHPARNPGSPMTYHLTFLQNGRLASIITPTNYTYSECVLNTGRYKVSVDKLVCTKATSTNPNAKLYGDIKVKAYLYDKGHATQVLMEGTPYEKTVVFDYRSLGSKDLFSGFTKSNPLRIAASPDDAYSIDKTFNAVYPDLQNVDMAKSHIAFEFDLYEKDTAQKDGLEVPTKKIYLEDILQTTLPSSQSLESDGSLSDTGSVYKFSDKNNFDFELHYTITPN